jgi:hypothetical protein
MIPGALEQSRRRDSWAWTVQRRAKTFAGALCTRLGANSERGDLLERLAWASSATTTVRRPSPVANCHGFALGGSPQRRCDRLSDSRGATPTVPRAARRPNARAVHFRASSCNWYEACWVTNMAVKHPRHASAHLLVLAQQLTQVRSRLLAQRHTASKRASRGDDSRSKGAIWASTAPHNHLEGSEHGAQSGV